MHEVSVGVAFPAYLGTEGTATVRSMTELPDLIAKLAELRGVSAEELTEALSVESCMILNCGLRVMV